VSKTFRAVVAVLLGAAGGCRVDPQTTARKYIARGDSYAAAKKLADAALEYRVAIKYAPRSGDAHLKLAEALAASGDLHAAFPEYLRAADLLPDRDDVQIKAGNMLLVAGRFADAKARARAMLLKKPHHTAAMILLGNALAGLNDLDNAVDVARKATDLDPQRAGTHQNVGVLELARGNREQAEHEFRRALDVDPRSVGACLALAELYRTTGRAREAEPWLKRALSIDPAHVGANQAIASYYIETGRAPEAEPYLKAAAGATSDGEARLGLADYYVALGRAADALAILTQVKSAPETYAAATTRIAMIEFAAGRGGRAQALVNEVLSKQPKNAAALTVKARLLLEDRRLDEALAMAQSAIEADPRAAAGRVTLGKILLARGEADPARSAFRDALGIDAHFVEAQIELARLHLARGETGAAIDYAERGLKDQPNSLDASLTLVRSLIAREDGRARADVELKVLAGKFPKSPRVYDATASLALVRKDMGAARRAWERAIALDATDIDALSGLTGLSLAANRPADARALVDRRLAQKPASTDLLLLSAKLHLITHDDAAAEAQFKKVVEIDPANLQAYSLLGRMYVDARRIDDAKREFAELAGRQPRSIVAPTMMGLLSEAQGDVEGAIAWYRRAVQINMRAASAANNLAMIYATRDAHLDEALELAQAAKAELPKVAAVNDTLGWIYYKKQLSTFAVRALTDSVDLDPSNPVHHYHLGLAYAQAGDDAAARRALDQALKLESDFQGAADARRVLATLVY
jgi:tetratricopeptide (TPR) repeat protein